ncbi:MAG: hypothetical protein ACOCUI_02675, partial [bacterium]
MKDTDKFELIKLSSELRNYFKEEIASINDYNIINEKIQNKCGIVKFFPTQQNYLDFMTFINNKEINNICVIRKDYGDFQTPDFLCDTITSYIKSNDVSPTVLLEPTFGKGNFILSALKSFTKLKKIYGIEIYEPYIWLSKFKILEYYIKTKKTTRIRIELFKADIFKFDLISNIQIDNKIDYLLILGNPPWITNTQLETLKSKNLPLKNNIKSYKGLDAITGKSNFDISEYILLKLIKYTSAFSSTIALLTKDTVIKNLIKNKSALPSNICNILSLKIDANKYFNAKVQASLFFANFKDYENNNKSVNTSPKCKVGQLIEDNKHSYEYGWIDNKFVSNINLYLSNKKYDGTSSYIWRQGLKHDLTKIMVLEKKDNFFINGLKEVLELEDELIYGFIKSSEIKTPIIKDSKKYVIVTQKKVGEDTSYLIKYPKLYKYLKSKEYYFNLRKSRIYNNMPLYSIFGIGDYSFFPYKIAVSGFNKNPLFSLLLPVNNKPLMIDDTCYYVGINNLSEAIFLLG